MEPLTLERFSDEILLKIFSFIVSPTCVCDLAKVCSRFRKICQDNSLWEPIFLKYGILIQSVLIPSNIKHQMSWKYLFQVRMDYLLTQKREIVSGPPSAATDQPIKRSSWWNFVFGLFSDTRLNQESIYNRIQITPRQKLERGSHLKCIPIGAHGVGKTSLVRRICKFEWREDCNSIGLVITLCLISSSGRHFCITKFLC